MNGRCRVYYVILAGLLLIITGLSSMLYAMRQLHQREKNKRVRTEAALADICFHFIESRGQVAKLAQQLSEASTLLDDLAENDGELLKIQPRSSNRPMGEA